MSFLSTIFLWALPLIAAPVVVHLYRGRQTEEIDWGAMHFLNAAVTEGRRFERLEELILMALRILAIAALVFAFARPKISSSWLGGGQQSEVILVVDDSLSTSQQIGASEDEGILFDAIKAQAVEQLNQLGTSDRVQVLLASAGGRWLTPEALPCDSANRARLAEQFEELKPTQAAADLLNCVNQCVALESTEGIVQRRIIIFTDEQAHSWSLESKANWQQTGIVITDATPPTSVQVVLADSPQGAAQSTNLAASEVAANRTVVAVGEKIELRAEVSNFGATASEAAEVEWIWGGKPDSNSGEDADSADEFEDTGQVIGRSQVKPLEPGERTQVTHSVTVKKAGIHLATCRLAIEDPILLDKTNHVVIQAAKEIPILLVADETEARVSASALLSAALGYSKGKPSDWHSRYRPRIVSLDEFDEVSLAEYRVVLFPSLSDISRSKIEEIASYVRTGGGLWLACGSTLDRQVFNADWHDDGA
ncbi:MAG: VWA domain-containing protein, partial [Lacipirellulaceae bacterium]